MSLWVCGGTQGHPAGPLDRDHRVLYTGGVLLRDGELVLSGPDRCFKGLAPGLVCGEAAVHTLVDGAIVDTFTDPRLADVHDARILGGRLHVASTGSPGVLVDGELLAVDGHPNHLFEVDGQRWVTRGMKGDALCLGRPGRWALADVVVHDGLVAPDGVWFTAVDGRLLRVDPERGEVDRVVDLNAIDDRDGPLGWCRGLALDGDVAIVGFTRLRATRLRQNLAWVRGRLRGRQVASAHPTRVVTLFASS